MSRNLCLNKNCFRTGFCYLFKMCFQLLTHKNFIWVLDVQSFYDICSNGKKSRLRQGLRSMTRLCSKVGWKWSEKHRKSEISLIWCISTTNNAMWNHAKNSMKQLKRPTSLISHWLSDPSGADLTLGFVSFFFSSVVLLLLFFFFFFFLFPH